MSEDDDDDDHYNVNDVDSVSRDPENIRVTLENKRQELESKLKIVKHALNLLGGNDQFDEVYRAVEDAMMQ